ncbi:hypothetical protein L596_022077 [Steinernema carpocapsae]|uniref:Signal recognition particle 14 kDa protein n=1 Tax=Steinernema carpocapsae TaxID=34508 RepID=A0A4U5MKM2_STECR|nr:hypothetical protein L596_022077 [Steinernema carpocapsae]
MLIESDAFLVELNSMFQKSKMGGSDTVTITLKHYDGRTKPHPKDPKKAPKETENLCMFRARLGKKKISCVVKPKEVNKFQSAFSSVLQCNMDKMKKPEASKTSKKNGK